MGESLRFVKGEGDWSGWVFVWHEVRGKLYETRFRRTELPELCTGLWTRYTEGDDEVA